MNKKSNKTTDKTVKITDKIKKIIKKIVEISEKTKKIKHVNQAHNREKQGNYFKTCKNQCEKQ